MFLGVNLVWINVLHHDEEQETMKNKYHYKWESTFNHEAKVTQHENCSIENGELLFVCSHKLPIFLS